MTPAEAGRVLAAAAVFDGRLNPPSREDAAARAIAWAQALRADMPADWAMRAVVEHYGSQTSAVMPAHLNEKWRAVRRAEFDRLATARAVEAASGDGVPMPEYVKEAWRKALRSSDAP